MNQALLVSNILLWVLVLALALVLLALVRQLGVLHERIAPVGALMLRQGPKIGESAPVVNVTTLDGRALTIGSANAGGRSTLIVFVSPTCPVCKALVPVLKSTRSGERDWLDVILASDGEESEHRAYVQAQGLGALPYVLSTPLGMTYGAGRLPFAVVIDEAGVLRARGLINSREHLESLFEAKRRGVASLQQYLESGAGSRAA